MTYNADKQPQDVLREHLTIVSSLMLRTVRRHEESSTLNIEMSKCVSKIAILALLLLADLSPHRRSKGSWCPVVRRVHARGACWTVSLAHIVRVVGMLITSRFSQAVALIDIDEH